MDWWTNTINQNDDYYVQLLLLFVSLIVILYLSQIKFRQIINSEKIAYIESSLLDCDETASLIASCGVLSDDPSSKYFVSRTKNIAFVSFMQNKWFHIHRNYFIQSSEYNDFSGGYKRYYKEMEMEFIENKSVEKVLNKFKSTFNIPDGELILVQVQTSHFDINIKENECITGQGIHTDGKDYAMIVCLQRDNINGAENSLSTDLNGKNIVIQPFILNEGQALLFRDNKIYHYVNPAQLIDKTKKGLRTVLLAHYPAIYDIHGTVNPNNILDKNIYDDSIQLRYANK